MTERHETATLRDPAPAASLHYQVGLALAGSLLLALSARMQVPFWPVPMTMQTCVVLMLGAALGGRLAAATVALYLAEGAIGLPVFAAGGGAAVLMGPTGGYLAGFLAAAALVGIAFDRGFGRTLAGRATTLLAGLAVIFAAGLAWLGLIIGFPHAVEAGLLPFLPGEALKLALALAAVPLARRALRRG